MRKIRSIVLMNCEAKSALERANMILEEVGIFVQVDSLKSKLPKSFPPICICAGEGSYTSTSKLRAGPVLMTLVSILLALY